MPEQIDILTTNAPSAAYFTVDNTQPYVQTITPAASAMVNGSGYTKFLKGDSFMILSAGLNLPEAYTFWRNKADLISLQGMAQLSLFMEGVTTGSAYHIDVLGYNLLFYIPMDSYEIALDVFIDYNKQKMNLSPYTPINEPFILKCYLSQIKISMAGSPAVLNGKSLIINPFFKIIHNFPLYN